MNRQSLKSLLNPTETKKESVSRDLSGSLQSKLTPKIVSKATTLPRILIIDDDPTFGKIMQRVASQTSVDTTYCKNLDEFGELGNWNYDVAVVDYDLGAVTGVELTAYLENFTSGEIPVIMVSQTNQECKKKWPGTIRKFIHKSLGPYAVLDAAFKAHKMTR